MLYIKNAKVYTPYKIIKNCSLLIENKKIKKIISKRDFKIPSGTKIINAKGKIISSGFIDVHLQGAGGYDFLDKTTEAINRISETLVRFGTTSFLATTVFKNRANPHIENIVTSHPLGAQLLGIHLEGPFVNPKKKGMIRPNGISRCSQARFNKILKTTKDRLKMMTIAPELSAAIEIIKRLRRKNIVASFGHSDANLQETKKGIDKGIRHVTHIFNAMRPIHQRDPGPLPLILMDDRVSIQLITDGIHIHPAIIRLIVKLKGIKNIVLITDSMSSQGLPDGRYVYDGWEYESKKGVCRYKDGTLIGTALPLNEMVKRFIKFSGVSLLEVLQTVTINPARVLGIDNRKGSIGVGKDADLVIMDKDLNIFMTLIGGRIAYEKKEGK